MENSKANSKANSLRFTPLTMAQIAVCTALLCVLSPLAIPLPILVPITLQVMIVVLVALILNPVHALIAQLLYTLLGIAGLPVFSGGKSGFAALASPTGGFIIGFIFASFFISLLKGSGAGTRGAVRYILVAVFAGIPLVYIPGIIWFSVVQQVDLLTSAKLVAASFILVDVAKCVAAALFAVPLNAALKKIK